MARRLALLALAAIVFFAFGVPRWLVGDDGSGTSDPAATFAKVCRDHGGRVVIRRSTSLPPVERQCVVQYGATEYLMDTVSPHGWDRDAARLNQEGCEAAQRQQASTASESRVTFVYHADTGVCERRD